MTHSIVSTFKTKSNGYSEYISTDQRFIVVFLQLFIYLNSLKRLEFKAAFYFFHSLWHILSFSEIKMHKTTYLWKCVRDQSNISLESTLKNKGQNYYHIIISVASLFENQRNLSLLSRLLVYHQCTTHLSISCCLI